jgi:hypothetical protein
VDWSSLGDWSLRIGSIVLALVAILVAGKRHTEAQSNAWVTLLLKYIETELCKAARDRDQVHQFFRDPFVDSVAKSSMREEIERDRVEADQRLHAFVALIGDKAERLRQKKLARDNPNVHRYWDDQRTELLEPELTAALGMYDVLTDEYIEALRRFAWELLSARKVFKPQRARKTSDL